MCIRACFTSFPPIVEPLYERQQENRVQIFQKWERVEWVRVNANQKLRVWQMIAIIWVIYLTCAIGIAVYRFQSWSTKRKIAKLLDMTIGCGSTAYFIYTFFDKKKYAGQIWRLYLEEFRRDFFNPDVRREAREEIDRMIASLPKPPEQWIHSYPTFANMQPAPRNN